MKHFSMNIKKGRAVHFRESVIALWLWWLLFCAWTQFTKMFFCFSQWHRATVDAWTQHQEADYLVVYFSSLVWWGLACSWFWKRKGKKRKKKDLNFHISARKQERNYLLRCVFFWPQLKQLTPCAFAQGGCLYLL